MIKLFGGRRPRAALAISTAMAVASFPLLAGCGGGSGNAGGTKEFTYWSMFTKDEPEAKVLEKTISSFEKDTGVQVNVQWQGRDVLQKVTAALNTGDVPDLVDQADNALKGTLITKGQAMDLTSLYKSKIPGEGGKTLADVIPSKYDQFTEYHGKHYMVPVTVQGYAVWYDGKKLPDVASRPPKTWGQFSTLLGQLKHQGDNPLALDADIGYYCEYWVATAIVRALGPGSLHKLVQDKTGNGWRQPGVETAVQDMASLVDNKDFIPGYDSSKWPDVQRQWAQGKADFLFLGGWVPNESSTYDKAGFEYRAFNFPQIGDSGDYSVPVALNAFVVPSQAQNAPAAEKFITYFYNKNRLSKLSSDAEQQTPRPDIDVPPQLADLKQLLVTQDLSSINDSVPADFAEYDTRILQPMSQKLMTGQLSAQQFIDDMAQQQAQYWKLNG